MGDAWQIEISDVAFQALGKNEVSSVVGYRVERGVHCFLVLFLTGEEYPIPTAVFESCRPMFALEFYEDYLKVCMSSVSGCTSYSENTL
jgi:hypothetical protein